ncbi:MAG: FkbM family methyltransferase [Anaerolineae bacterium]|nr:FkbM family methyltransferase [Anaerolineae bacterium]NUQ05726.1 FkbM family methyltransferase [Anaerolineae bacterium]
MSAGKLDYDYTWIFACAQHAVNVFDIGCNIGNASLIMLLSPSPQSIVLVDPNPDALSIAAEHLIKNTLSHYARFVCAFVSDKQDEQVAFWTVGAGAAGSMYSAHAKSASKAQQSTRVSTTTVDALCARFGVTPDLIKVDVEGAERLVLAGASACAAQHKTRFFVEVHSNPDLPMVENAEYLLKWCAEHDYAAWYLRDKIRLTSPDPVADRGRCHWLLQPASWEFPSWLMPLEQGAPLEKALAAAS